MFFMVHCVYMALTG